MSTQSDSTNPGNEGGHANEQLLTSIDGIVWEADARTFRFTFVSPQAEEILGYPLRRWLEPGFWSECIHSEDRAWAVEYCRQATAERRRHAFEYRMVAADGRIVWLRDVVSVICEEGEARWLRGIMVDVTDRKRTEEALCQSEELYRLLTENSNDLIYLLDLEGRILYASPSVGRLLRRVPGERFEVVHPDDVEAGQAYWERILAGGKELLTVRVADADDTWHWLEAWSSLITFQGEPRVLSVCRDITARKRAEENVRAGEARFRTFVDHATDAFFLHDAGGTVVDVNRQACESLGWTREELIGNSPREFDIDMSRTDLDLFAARLDAGEVITFETRHRRKDGSVFPVEVRVRPFWEEGRRYGVSLARDITGRRRAEKDLRESQERLRLAVQATGLGPWDWDLNTDAVHFSPEWKRQLGYEPEEISSRYEEWVGRLHPDDQERVLDALREYLDGRRPDYAVEFRLRHKDGTYRWIYTRGLALRDADGKPSRMLGCHLDISERKHAEHALVESHGLLQAVTEGTSDAVFVKDLEGRYLMINTAGARLLDRPVNEVLGRGDRELFAAETAQRVRQRDLHLMANGESETFEETATAAGVTRTYHSTKGVYRDGQGNVIGIVGIARDVTELKRLEDQLRQAQRMEAVGRLAGGVAHDFNNLLTVINGYSELVFGQLRPDDPSREPVAQVQQAGERAAKLTRQLLAFSRKQVLQPRLFCPNTLLDELFRLLKRLIGEDIELALQPDGALGMTEVDPSQFEQTIINLAINARDAMPGGGQLIVKTENVELAEDDVRRHAEARPGRYVLISVRDSGQGMDEATKARIFEPFFTTKESGQGTGLGLAMVYGFVKQSGGHVEVESEPGHGATFKVYLPRASEAAPSVDAGADLLTIPGGTETILLVEDEDSVRTLTRLFLQSSGYTVLEARDGEDGFWVAQQQAGPIHLLVTDLVMPRMSGRQLADRLKETRTQLRVLYMSGYSDDSAMHHGMLEANRAFLHKPFSALALGRKVREVLDAAEAPR